MAAADYRSCDVCGGKVFYDSNLNYEFGPSDKKCRGEDYRLDDLGDWAVICLDCAKTHVCVVIARSEIDPLSLT